MFDAQLIGTQSDGSALAVFSPWMPREGDRVLATIDLIMATYSSLTGSVQVKVYHKNSTDTDAGTAAIGTITATSVGRMTEEFGPLKELVRYKITVSATTFQQEWAMFRMLSPVWFDSVAT